MRTVELCDNGLDNVHRRQIDAVIQPFVRCRRRYRNDGRSIRAVAGLSGMRRRQRAVTDGQVRSVSLRSLYRKQGAERRSRVLYGVRTLAAGDGSHDIV
jgi:hypothetical protein